VFADDASGNWVQNAPKWSGRLGLERAIADSWTVAAEELFSSQRLAIDNTAIPGYALSNFTLTRRPHAGRVDCSFSLYNAFNRAYAQPVAGWAGDRVDALGRTWRAAVGYSF
jgi:outer membrane receptor protein involved in Fe transport